MTGLPLPDGFSLLVTGSLSAKPDDRSHTRDQIRPVQLLRSDGAHMVGAFDHLGDLGVSSFAFVDDDVCVFSTGADLVRLELGSGERTDLGVPRLVDVHEITPVGGSVWLSNTGADEIVRVQVDSGEVAERIDLGVFRGRVRPEADEELVDRFHCNQVFLHQGHVWVLVHHTKGRQLVRRVARKLLKVQGDGGVLDVTNGDRKALGLVGPHNVRRVTDGWWVFDSGAATIGVFSDDWQRTATIRTGGWGRGAELSPDGTRFYAGMSPVRRRYRAQIGGNLSEVPLVEVYDTSSNDRLAAVELADIEQVNNLYLVPDTVADRLLALQ